MANFLLVLIFISFGFLVYFFGKGILLIKRDKGKIKWN